MSTCKRVLPDTEFNELRVFLMESGSTGVSQQLDYFVAQPHRLAVVRGVRVRAKFSSGSPRGGSPREQFRFGLGRQPIGRRQQDYESERSSPAD
jgi:hypothetical protein